MSSTVQIPQDVLEVLAAGRAEGPRFYLPATQLDRELYMRVKKTLELLRGTWKGGKVGAFVFDRDIKESIDAAVAAGSFTDERKEYQFFETPRAVAEQMVSLAELEEGNLILEPSAGKAALAKVISTRMPVGCGLHVGELNPGLRALLPTWGYTVVCDDFLSFWPDFPYCRIIQNPPFSNRQDAEHVIHAYYCLAPKGVLVSVMSAGVLFRKETEYAEVRHMINAFGGEIVKLPPDSFRESGANVNAVLVKIRKPDSIS